MGCSFTRDRDRGELNLPLTGSHVPGPQAQMMSYLRPRKMLERLPVPLPILLSLLIGGIGGELLDFRTYMIVLTVLFIITPCFYSCAMALVARKIKQYIEAHDKDMIGVDVHIDKVDLSVLTGRLVVHEVVVENPEGYHCDHLFRADRLVFDLDVEELLKTRGTHICVEEFGLENIELCIEYNSVVFGTGTSNVQWILDFMQKKKEEDQKADQDANKPEDEKTNENAGQLEEGKDVEGGEDKNDTNWKCLRGRCSSDAKTEKKDGKCFLSCCSGGAKKKKKNERKTSLHKVEFIDVGANMATMLGSTKLACADIKYKNFEAETGAKGLSATDMVDILFKSLIKSVMANITANVDKVKTLMVQQ